MVVRYTDDGLLHGDTVPIPSGSSVSHLDCTGLLDLLIWTCKLEKKRLGVNMHIEISLQKNLYK